MDRQARDRFAHDALIAHLGPSGPFEIVLGGWPVFDSLMAVLLFQDDRPLFATSVLAQALGHRSRVEVTQSSLPAKEDLIDWARHQFGEDAAVSTCQFGRWEALWLGEVDYPVPVAPLSDAELAVLPTEVEDMSAMAGALRNGAYAAHTRTLVVADSGGPIEAAFELSELLGFAPEDHQWIPQRWRTSVAQPGFSWGFEPVEAADGSEVWLRYYSYRLSNASVYLPRVWLGARLEDAHALKLTASWDAD